MDSLQRAIHEEVRIRPPDPGWAAAFETEKRRLQAALPGRLPHVEHVGSTAVPRLAGKPIIDIMAGVSSLDEADRLLEPLCALAYVTSAAYNATQPDRRWLMRQEDGRRTHHLHLVVHGGDRWYRVLRFRDLLRSDPDLARRYEALKREVAERHRGDREAYTAAKGDFIAAALRPGH